ncbi:MAG: M48 family metallopeptidase [Opitutales bacterium]
MDSSGGLKVAGSKRIEMTLETQRGRLRVPLRVVRRRGLRHLKVSVDLNNEVVLNVPARVSEAKALDFVREQAEWVRRVLERSPEKLSLYDYLERRPVLSGNGMSWSARVRSALKAGFVADEEARTVDLFHAPDGGREASLIAALRAFANDVIRQRVSHLAEEEGLTFNRLTVRDQRSRWGSCSERGTLSFNWRLVLLPVELHDYLLWHELAHLTHLNHSRAFWDLVAQYDPDCRAHDAGLTEWSRTLLRLGRNRPVTVLANTLP